MKKLLISGAAALLLSATCAYAGSTTWIRLVGRPDVFAITQQGDAYTQIHYLGGVPVGGGMGMTARTNYEGKSIVLFNASFGGHGQYYCYNIGPQSSSRIGSWVAYYTDKAGTVKWDEGTYTVLRANPLQ